MARSVDLTSGPMAGQLLRLCFPLLVANVLQQLYNIINSLVVTRYVGGAAFAALGVAESVMNLFIYVITGACMGASVLVARFFGEKDLPRLRQQLYVSAVLIGGCTLAAVALGQLFLPQVLRLIHTPDELMADASVYLRVILLGMAFTFTYNYLASSLRAIGNTKAALCFLLISLGYNLAAAWLLVAVLGLGIVGTALATVSAQLLSSALCFFYIRKRLPFLRIERSDMKMDRGLAHLTGSYAAVAALQQSSLFLGKLMVQSAVNDLGTAAISAFTAANRVENFVQAFGSSGCETIAIFVAQNRGAGKHRRAMGGFLLCGLSTVGVGVLFSVLMRLRGELLVLPFLSGEGADVLALGASYLSFLGAFYFLSFWGFAFVGWFRGEGRMNITFWGTTLQVGLRVVGTYLLVDAMGLDAVALSTGLGWVAIVLFQLFVFFLEQRGIWPRKAELEQG